MKIGIISGGKMGTAIAQILGKKGYAVRVYIHTNKLELLKKIQKTRINEQYFPGIKLSNNLTFVNNYQELVRDSDVLAFAVPSGRMNEITKAISAFVSKNQLIMNFSKGLHHEGPECLSKIISKNTGNDRIVVLSGPSLASELIQEMPTALTVASKKTENINAAINLFSNDYLTFDTTDDVLGVEIAGAIKNPLAILYGICEGVGYGHNTKSYILHEGLQEIKEIGLKMGTKPDTFDKYCGTPDVILTCLGGRNMFFGVHIGKGKHPKEILDSDMKGVLVEGYSNTKLVMQIIKKYDLELPLMQTLHGILFENYNPKESIKNILGKKSR